MKQFLRSALIGIAFLTSSSLVWASPETTTAATESYITSLPTSRAETVQVKVNISLSSPSRVVNDFYYYDLSNPNARYTVNKLGPKMTCSATNGKWLFLASVLDRDEMKSYIIVRENVEINGDTNIEMSDSEAHNHITMKTVLPNGEELRINSIDDTGTMLNDGNCKQCAETIVLFRKDTNLVRALSKSAQVARYKSEIDGDIELNGDFYISDVSDALALSVIRKCTTIDYEVYTAVYEFGASINSDRELTNGDWFKLQSDYAEVPDSEIKADGDYYQIASCNFFDDCDMDGINECATYSTGKPYSYISLPEPTMTGMNLHRFLVIPGKAIGTNGQSGAMRDFYRLVVPPVAKLNGKMTHLVYPFDYMGAMRVWYNKEDPGFFLGRSLYYHPRFSWAQEEDETPVYGGNVPITVLTMIWDDFDINCWFAGIVGRFGEQRDVDKYLIRATVEQDGEEVKNGNLNEVISWSYEACKPNPEAKAWKITSKNENVLIDGNIASNVTVAEFNTGREDFIPPTLTMLNFRNADDKIADRFEKPENGTLEFSATDATPHASAERNIWCDFNGVETVKVEYSAEGANTWRELTVAEVPELFFTPGYGAFYRGSLKDVVNNSASKWYDLRVTVGDKAGNTQTQTLSPAFRIDEQLGLDNLTADRSIAISVEGKQLKVMGTTTDANVEIYDLAGRKVLAAKATSVGLGGLTGAYIVKVTDSNRIDTFKIAL